MTILPKPAAALLTALSLLGTAQALPKDLKSGILGLTVQDVQPLTSQAASKATSDMKSVAKSKGYLCQKYEAYYAPLQVVTFRPLRKQLLAGGYKETVLTQKLPNAAARSALLANGFTLRRYQKSSKIVLIFMRLPPGIADGNVTICLAKKA